MRRIIEAEGLKLFVDPTSHLGQSLLNHGTYEPETIAMFREHVRAGDTVLDIGANEGFFSSMAANIVGPNGRVIAVEPQSRLQDVVEINLALNASCPTHIIKNVVAETDAVEMEITLFPGNNTGASSLVRNYRWGATKETVTTITPSTILGKVGVDRVDFVKIDVEGFEPEVIRSLLPLLRAKRIGKLLLDYHTQILSVRGIDPQPTHDAVLASGYKADGQVKFGYVMYTA